MATTGAKSEEHFRRIPWCAALLDKPGTATFLPSFRSESDIPGYPASQDTLMRVSLSNSDTVPHCLGFHEAPPDSPSNGETRLLVNSVSLLFEIGTGVKGFHGSAHGGFVSVICDDAMGALLYQNLAVQIRKKGEDPAWKLPEGVIDLTEARFATAGMDVRLQRLVPTPGVVVATASLTKVDGRKMGVDVVIKDERGRQLATCKGLWVSLLPAKI